MKWKHIFPAKLVARFAIVGVAAAIVSLVVLWLAVDKAGLHYIVGGIFSWATATYLAYVGNAGWVFRVYLNWRGVARFVSSRGATTVIGFGLYAVFVEVGIWYMAASVLSTAVVTFGNYITARYWVWRH